MNITKAKSLLQLHNGDTIDKARNMYQVLVERAQKSLMHSSNPAVKQQFEKRIIDLNEAMAFIEDNASEFTESNLDGFSLFWNKSKNRYLVYVFIVVLVVFISYFGYLNVQGNRYFKQGKELMELAFNQQDNAKFKEAILLFDVAIQYGHKGALYEKGHCTFKLGDRVTGVKLMKEAVELGYNNPEKIKFYNFIAGQFR